MKNEVELMADKLKDIATKKFVKLWPTFAFWLELAVFVIRENEAAYEQGLIAGQAQDAPTVQPAASTVLCDVPDCGNKADFIINSRALCAEHKK